MIIRLTLVAGLALAACSSPTGPGSDSPRSVTFRVDYADGCRLYPLWFVYREGTGPWIPAREVTPRVWEFTVSDQQVMTAMALGTDLGASRLISHAFDARSTTIADGLEAECQRQSPPVRFITVRMPGLLPTESATIQTEWFQYRVRGPESFQMPLPSTGTTVVMATKLPTTSDALPGRMVITRDLQGDLLDVDFDGPLAIEAESDTLTGAELVEFWPTTVGWGYRGAACASGALLSPVVTVPLEDGKGVIRGVPSAHQAPDELHVFQLRSSGGGFSIAVEAYRRHLGPVNVTPLPLIARPTLTALPGAHERYGTTVTVPQGYNAHLRLELSEDRSIRSIAAYIDGSLLSDGPTTVEIPDLSSAPGWSPDLAMAPGSAGSWAVTAVGSTGGHAWHRRPCIDGMTVLTARQIGRF